MIKSGAISLPFYLSGGGFLQKINNFKITRLSLAGFKCFEDRVSFDFGDKTFITAANGLGKSSIADAIAYAFTGTPFFGGNGLDRLQNRNARELEVSTYFIDDTGAEHILTRSRKRGATTITYDGFEIRQADINELFCDKDTFLSIFNPLYFIDVLGDSGRGMLEKLLPVVSHEDVLSAMSKRSRELLKEEFLLSPETYIKYRRAEIKELEQALIGYNAKQELLHRQREERVHILVELQLSLEEVRTEIAGLDKNPDTDAKLTLLHAEHKSVSDAIRYISAENKCPTCSTVMTFVESDEVKSDIQRRLSVLNDKIRALTPTASANLSPEQPDRITGLKNAIREYEAKIDVLNSLPNHDYSVMIAECEAEISRLKTLVGEAISYAAVRAELMLAGLKMNRAVIVLSEIVKSTGEVKDCFRFSYDGRDYRCLSLSEKIKTGLEVSELIKRLSGRNYPVFVDNGESICAIDNIKPTGQMIFSRVVRGEELKVTYKGESGDI